MYYEYDYTMSPNDIEQGCLKGEWSKEIPSLPGRYLARIIKDGVLVSYFLTDLTEKEGFLWEGRVENRMTIHQFCANLFFHHGVHHEWQKVEKVSDSSIPFKKRAIRCMKEVVDQHFKSLSYTSPVEEGEPQTTILRAIVQLIYDECCRKADNESDDCDWDIEAWFAFREILESCGGKRRESCALRY